MNTKTLDEFITEYKNQLDKLVKENPHVIYDDEYKLLNELKYYINDDNTNYLWKLLNKTEVV